MTFSQKISKVGSAQLINRLTSDRYDADQKKEMAELLVKRGKTEGQEYLNSLAPKTPKKTKTTQMFSTVGLDLDTVEYIYAASPNNHSGITQGATGGEVLRYVTNAQGIHFRYREAGTGRLAWKRMSMVTNINDEARQLTEQLVEMTTAS